MSGGKKKGRTGVTKKAGWDLNGIYRCRHPLLGMDEQKKPNQGCSTAGSLFNVGFWGRAFLYTVFFVLNRLSKKEGEIRTLCAREVVRKLRLEGQVVNIP